MDESNKKRRADNKLRLRVKKHRAISGVIRSLIDEDSSDDNVEHGEL